MQTDAVKGLVSVTQEPNLNMRMQVFTKRQLAEPFTGVPLLQCIALHKAKPSQPVLKRKPSFSYGLFTMHRVFAHRGHGRLS